MLSQWREEYKGPMRFALWCSLVIYGPVVIWSVGKAVYEDHEGLVGRSKAQRLTITANAATLQNTTGEFTRQLGDCGVQKAHMDGENKTLSTQNRDQQNTINNCQTQALKLLTPAAQKTTVVLLDTDMQATPHKSRFIMITNKDVNPVASHVICNQALSSGFLQPIGAPATMGGSPVKLAPNALRFFIQSPPWTPTEPFLMTVTYEGADIVCRFDLD